ncbi:4-hydroxy-3-methylbut-2-enyl diphosphate reductase [Desulfobacter hydrogenophilus]|uniref:4-hydroxy-3-methylbut-2-enyl diphosphate reductase n=1 Tax=Desulfobacter hydrogenophilus TaxID=2291 RepID=A0A328FED2_9BACT|nr:4-hydroxy-3-methylbut-2-enyl diphosphate reductase [Desulfobacter hydrogenophilus]NDY72154.1 4-hydroxy-3-methylbut-2-enyl diphosphate reductase [Desulfobacter hydrogenophilus]QBH14879.1 4-hydroxy-3-methylbut-2-enyl diphosphate reductase [Desulfobacter hydrogenophilus]RAM01387.1 4-hydroxy-3-methylbut-2-enyl diphosphate reductase [Desulfobacter hydrogenophilus]
MKISIAKTAGFCMGVRRAVDMVLDASNKAKEPIYTYGPLIHNPQVLEMLESKQIFRMDTIPESGKGIVLIRAHGVPPQDEKALADVGFTVINATCPRVVRVQVIIDKYSKKGYDTIILGDEKHPEVIGLLGYARDKGHTVTNLDELQALPIFEKAVVVAQTTQNTKIFADIQAWCRKNVPHYEIFNTICDSTEKRQNEVREMAVTHDAVIVVGGKFSGNTKRLAQVAAETGKPSMHIEQASEIDYESIAHAKSIAITAGASTPNWIINDTCSRVEQAFREKQPGRRKIMAVMDVLMKANIILAAGAACLTLGAAMISGAESPGVSAVIAMFYILSMQIMNNMMTIGSDTYNKPDRAALYKQNRGWLLLVAFLSGAIGLYLAWTRGWGYFGVLLVMMLLGMSYTRTIFPSFSSGRKIYRLKDVPGSKTILIAVAWGVVTSLMPGISLKAHPGLTLVAFVFTTGLSFARTAFMDILAIQGDRIAGRETLPILLGKKKSLKFVHYTLVATMIIPLILSVWGSPVVCGLALIPAFMFILTIRYKTDSDISANFYEFWFEFPLLLAGIIAVAG